MSDPDHKHKWQTIGTKNMLACASTTCNTVRKLEDVIRDVELDIALRTKVQVLNGQLFARQLKKPAHDDAYAWVRENAPAISVPVDIPQVSLL